MQKTKKKMSQFRRHPPSLHFTRYVIIIVGSELTYGWQCIYPPPTALGCDTRLIYSGYVTGNMQKGA